MGDDVYGEDPTVRGLEELAPEITGKEAALLAQGFADIAGLYTEPARVRTNILYFDLERGDPAEFHDHCRKRGVLFHRTGERRFRLVTHYGITRPDIDHALGILAAAVESP